MFWGIKICLILGPLPCGLAGMSMVDCDFRRKKYKEINSSSGFKTIEETVLIKGKERQYMCYPNTFKCLTLTSTPYQILWLQRTPIEESCLTSYY